MSQSADETDFVNEPTVFASDTDFTHLSNNTRYVKYLMNTFNTQFYDTKTITDFEIQFAKETSEDSVLRIYKKVIDCHEYHFVITCGGDVVVKARIHYSDESRNWCNIQN